MPQPFEVTEQGDVRIVGAVIRDNAQALINYLVDQGLNFRISPLRYDL